MPKTTKHRLEDNEYIMHKMQKLDELELQKILTPVQGGNADSYQLKELDFDIESFIKEISTMTASVSAIPPAVPAVAIKNNKTLVELKDICDETIKPTSVEEDEIIKKDIQKIAEFLRDTHKTSSHRYTINTFDKLEENFNTKLAMLFNILIYKNYDVSKSDFNPDSATILYKQLYKVNVYIQKIETGESKIYFGFPFYLTIHINILGKVFMTRKNIYKLFEKSDEIDKIHYYTDNTGFNILDMITAAKFIGFVITNYFTSGADLMSKLLHTIEIYKMNPEKIRFNNVVLNFERFFKLYKQVITQNISLIPIRD